MAKVKDKPQRLPLPLSFVEGDTFVLCYTTQQIQKIRERYEDSDGKLINPDEYLRGLTEALVVDEAGALLFREGEVRGLFDPWQREAFDAVTDIYSPASKKNSRGDTTSPPSSPSTAEAAPSMTPKAGSGESPS